MKILVSDFDKTLYTDDYKENIEAINKFVEKGNIFIIATGRNLKSLQKNLDPSLNCQYIICNDGGAIYDRKLKPIYRKDICDEIVEPLYNILKRDPSVGNPLIDLTTSYSDVPCDNTNAIIAKIINRDKAQILLEKLKTKFLSITGYISDNWINIDDQSVSKGNAIKIICNLIEYDYKDVYAIGDNLNDINMCEICNGVAIENALPELAKVCKVSVKSVKELVELL